MLLLGRSKCYMADIGVNGVDGGGKKAKAAMTSASSDDRTIRNRVTVILGAQFGDEGKGKIVDLLCQKAHIVCRCQVSPSHEE